ncbi:agmatinase family protein [Gluconacetobacter azotocaptans]|uniref:arginase family protein n=1 Tax=Gluconacetobacter azotocaptans TaxID=142834 RepID=UPI001958B13F|nr:agmatinase family protein [Gluconacetobacter azotocaptans]
MSNRMSFRAERRAALAALAFATLAPALVPAAHAAPVASASTDALTPEQKAFVADSATLERFGLTREKMAEILAAKDPQAARATVAAMMGTIAADKFQPPHGPAQPGRSALDPDGDMAAVQLNPAAGGFNSMAVVRPPALDAHHRAPGPFSVRRYMYESQGIPTFAGAPLALRKDDLVAGKVDVAFVGVPLGFSSGWRDAHNAPGVMRAMYGLGDFDVYAGVDPGLVLNLADYGNFAVDKMSVELSVNHVRQMVGEMVDAKVVPFVVGGDHSVMIPTVTAMADHYGAGNVGLVQIDAHNDVARDQAHFYSDEQALSRLIESGTVKGGSVVQIGTRGPGLSAADFDWMKSKGIRYHTMAQVETSGWQSVVDTTLREIESGPQNIFVSFDISALDPAYASGAGRPAPNGLTMREAVPLVRRICAETKVVGFAMLDVAPYLDLSYATALNADQIMNACLTGIAMRKLGVKGANYHSALTVESAVAH